MPDQWIETYHNGELKHWEIHYEDGQWWEQWVGPGGSLIRWSMPEDSHLESDGYWIDRQGNTHEAPVVLRQARKGSLSPVRSTFSHYPEARNVFGRFFPNGAGHYNRQRDLEKHRDPKPILALDKVVEVA